MTVEHFGVKLIKKSKKLKLNREEFALINTKPSQPYSDSLSERNAYVDDKGSAYREEWCKEYRELCLKNYDLNMQFFSSLDAEEFNNQLSAFLRRHKCFKKVHDLKEYAGVEGYYIIVLDEYKQVYIGKSNDIKKRMLRHWSSTLPFDRTLFPMYAYTRSCFSIDFFRAFDTTRIYAWKRRQAEGLEKELVADFSPKYCTNRIGGDVSNALEAIATINRRQFEANS